MKKIDKSGHFARLSYARLYRDDLERIAELMKEQSLEVLLKDDDYEYESIEEIVERRGERKSQIEIIGKTSDDRWRNVTFEVNGRTLQLRADGELELIWHRIKDFVASKTPWYSRYADAWIWGGITFVLINQYISFIDFKTKKLMVPVWFNSLVVVAALIFAFSIFKTITDRGVVLVHRHAAKNFWVRNADRILMLIIGAIVGAFGKYIAKMLFGVE